MKPAFKRVTAYNVYCSELKVGNNGGVDGSAKEWSRRWDALSSSTKSEFREKARMEQSIFQPSFAIKKISTLMSYLESNQEATRAECGVESACFIQYVKGDLIVHGFGELSRLLHKQEMGATIVQEFEKRMDKQSASQPTAHQLRKNLKLKMSKVASSLSMRTFPYKRVEAGDFSIEGVPEDLLPLKPPGSISRSDLVRLLRCDIKLSRACRVTSTSLHPPSSSVTSTSVSVHPPPSSVASTSVSVHPPPSSVASTSVHSPPSVASTSVSVHPPPSSVASTSVSVHPPSYSVASTSVHSPPSVASTSVSVHPPSSFVASTSVHPPSSSVASTSVSVHPPSYSVASTSVHPPSSSVTSTSLLPPSSAHQSMCPPSTSPPILHHSSAQPSLHPSIQASVQTNIPTSARDSTYYLHMLSLDTVPSATTSLYPSSPSSLNTHHFTSSTSFPSPLPAQLLSSNPDSELTLQKIDCMDIPADVNMAVKTVSAMDSGMETQAFPDEEKIVKRVSWDKDVLGALVAEVGPLSELVKIPSAIKLEEMKKKHPALKNIPTQKIYQKLYKAKHTSKKK